MVQEKVIDNKLVSFIFCISDDSTWQKAVEYISKIIIPEGYSINIIEIRDAKGLCSGYNLAMDRAKGKYKVYMHQDVFIYNQNFISDFISLFNKYPDLGIMGMAGAEKLPSSGIWWQSKCNFGALYRKYGDRIRPARIGLFKEDYKKVQALDGLILITQYDIFWREDLFKGWHFYDISQCMEFLKAGYKVGIPNQVEPWVEHVNGNDMTGYTENRKIFLMEYSDFFDFNNF
ncbi:glycosyltransferase family protein [Clostridium sp. FP2]|uniref:glycosyltransferase family protein n=1 Tax=Clostridium sp. FP2 TaxID=2724481 RepID=UPI0013E95265|nr:glycosyltransferase family protein [Clostridium sp. FP2]MBZ9622600.1 glycosyltransferase family protein [Clostridium sp. FP2]